MSTGSGERERRGSTETGRFTVRRVRSAIASWRTSVRRTDILVASIFAALSLGLGAYVFARAQAAAHLRFTESAQRLQAAIARGLLLPTEDLTSLSNFLETSGQTTRWQFRRLTFSMLERHKLIYAFEYLPIVKDSERSLFEAEARDAGLADYRFWEVGPDGKSAAAGVRPYYVPIHYMEPPSALALGFDVAADPLRWATAAKARDSGRIAASSPFKLIEDAGKPDALPVVAMYAPVYKEGDPGVEATRSAALTGLAMAIFRVAPLVDSAAASTDATGLGFALRDLEAPKAPWMAQRPKDAAALHRRGGFLLEFPVPFADRQWALAVFPLAGAFQPSRRGAIGVAAAGVLASLLGLITITSLRTILRLRRQVEKVGPYRLVARLGHGAMGVVWEARHALLRRPTAIKLLAPGVEGERAIARFEREVQLTAGLTHPSTIAIYDYGRTAEGIFYYAMELIRGINLLQLVTLDGPIVPARVVNLLRQACGALSEAHAAGLIHRDIKPANLMISVYGGIPDFLKVLDFGLVKDVGAVEQLRPSESGAGIDATLSQDGSLLGTPLYMAPEGMSSPSDVDARADLFALGAVGYFLLTGHSPFPGRTAIEVFKMERQGPPPPLSKEAKHPVPAPLDRILSRCLSFRREDRPCSAEELDAMLETCAVTPPWNTEQARAWWQTRGPAALEAARAQRQEQPQMLTLASGGRAGT